MTTSQVFSVVGGDHSGVGGELYTFVNCPVPVSVVCEIFVDEQATIGVETSASALDFSLLLDDRITEEDGTTQVVVVPATLDGDVLSDVLSDVEK
jgi:hypothetical protein